MLPTLVHRLPPIARRIARLGSLARATHRSGIRATIRTAGRLTVFGAALFAVSLLVGLAAASVFAAVDSAPALVAGWLLGAAALVGLPLAVGWLLPRALCRLP